MHILLPPGLVRIEHLLSALEHKLQHKYRVCSWDCYSSREQPPARRDSQDLAASAECVQSDPDPQVLCGCPAKREQFSGD